MDYDDVGPRVGIYLGEDKFIAPYDDDVSNANGSPITLVGQRFQASDLKPFKERG